MRTSWQPNPPHFNLDVNAAVDKTFSQFRGLNFNEPGQWPPLPKFVAWLLAAVVVVGLAWVAVLSDATDELQTERDREPALKSQFRDKLGQAVNLEELRKQKLQVEEYVTQLEKQLPGKADMDALLSDINQAGLGRGLQFELFRPGQVEVKDFYAVLPIAIRISGRYHDMGSFAADVANLSRIVTLQDVAIARPAANQQAKDNAGPAALVMEATARTYRYLDKDEVAEQRNRKAAADKAQKGGK